MPVPVAAPSRPEPHRRERALVEVEREEVQSFGGREPRDDRGVTFPQRPHALVLGYVPQHAEDGRRGHGARAGRRAGHEADPDGLERRGDGAAQTSGDGSGHEVRVRRRRCGSDGAGGRRFAWTSESLARGAAGLSLSLPEPRASSASRRSGAVDGHVDRTSATSLRRCVPPEPASQVVCLLVLESARATLESQKISAFGHSKA